MINQEQLKNAVGAVVGPLGVKSYLLLYMDGPDKIKFTGEASIQAFMPLITEYLMSKISGTPK